MKRIIVLLCCMFLLTACGAFMAGSAFSTLVINDNRDMSTMTDDKEIAYKAQDNINNDKVLKDHANISVTSYNRSVLMVGRAENEEYRARAYSSVRSVEDVKKVYNEVVIGDPSYSTYSDDTWITTKVKSAMVSQSKLKSTQIKVVTEDGVVYLMGLILPSQANLAVKTAKDVEGVKKVVNLFDYLS
jgi:osmotically-inducible protein OsmY